MTIAEANRFYEQDKKEYKIETNKELLNWLKLKVKEGYYSFCNLDDLQKLIDYITSWYEIKYPEREMRFYDGYKTIGFENIKSLSRYMNFNQLVLRLPRHQLYLIKCGYRAQGGGTKSIKNEKGETIGLENYISIRVNRKNIDKNNKWKNGLPYFLIFANPNTGVIESNPEINKLIGQKEYTLEEMLTFLEENKIDEFDFKELKDSINDYKVDIELRDKILQLVALNLLYSSNTIPEYGYERAKRFINEFNKKLGLNLNTNDIDEIMKRDYTKEVLPEFLEKLSEKVNNNEYYFIESENKKILKSFVKSLFKK